MPTTDSHNLPYPSDSDPADVPADIGALAEAVDAKLDDVDASQITGATNGQILVADSSGVVTPRTASGDVTVSNTGVTTIGSGAVNAAKLGSSAVTTAKIDTGAVTADKLATGAVTSDKILDGTITNTDVSASAAIAESKLSLASDAAAATASRRTLGTGSTQACAGNDSRLSNSRTPTGNAGGSLSGTYPNPGIASNAVDTAQINDVAVTTAKVADDAITADKLQDDASTDGNRAVTTNHIRDAAVTTAKINDGAVTGGKLAASTTATATNGSNVSGTLTARKYADGLVVLSGSLLRSSGSGATLATLPAGYRPTTASQFAAHRETLNVALSPVSISTAGAITTAVENGATHYLDGISFHAA